MEEHARAWPRPSIDILNATGSGFEPGRPNYRVIGRSLGLPKEIASLLEDFSSMSDGADLKKPQKLLATYLLSQVVERVPFLSSLREHVPRGCKLKIDIDTKGVAVQIKMPLPPLVW